jgi:hypothetical protein
MNGDWYKMEKGLEKVEGGEMIKDVVDIDMIMAEKTPNIVIFIRWYESIYSLY